MKSISSAERYIKMSRSPSGNSKIKANVFKKSDTQSNLLLLLLSICVSIELVIQSFFKQFFRAITFKLIYKAQYQKNFFPQFRLNHYPVFTAVVHKKLSNETRKSLISLKVLVGRERKK